MGSFLSTTGKNDIIWRKKNWETIISNWRTFCCYLPIFIPLWSSHMWFLYLSEWALCFLLCYSLSFRTENEAIWNDIFIQSVETKTPQVWSLQSFLCLSLSSIPLNKRINEVNCKIDLLMCECVMLKLICKRSCHNRMFYWLEAVKIRPKTNNTHSEQIWNRIALHCTLALALIFAHSLSQWPRL